jgi:hypothetical protein
MASLPRPKMDNPSALGDMYPREEGAPPSIDWDAYDPPGNDDSVVILGDRIKFDRA